MKKKAECEIVQDLLLGYVDNILNSESKKIVEKHLIECENCQNRLKEIKNDIEENENNEKKQIDYLKKVRIKNKIKSILFVITILILILFGYYLYKFSILNRISKKSREQFKTENFYIEKIEKIGNDDKLSVTKTWYKDGKYKVSWCTKNDADGSIENLLTEYQDLKSNPNEKYDIDEYNKKIQKITWNHESGKDDLIEVQNPTFPSSKEYLLMRLGAPFHTKISTDYEYIGRKYYVLKSGKTETWVDIDTGLPIMKFGGSTMTVYYNNTKIPKERTESISEYHYEFNTVNDTDVEMPDITGYEIENIDYNEMIKEQTK